MKVLPKSSLLLTAVLIAASLVFNHALVADDGIGNTDHYFTRVSGYSMFPTLKSGDTTVVYKAFPYKKLRVGDIVVVRSERGFSVIHRIVARYRGGMWVTKGDNNPKQDREVLTSKNFQGLALVGESALNRYYSNLDGQDNLNVQMKHVALAYSDSERRHS